MLFRSGSGVVSFWRLNPRFRPEGASAPGSNPLRFEHSLSTNPHSVAMFNAVFLGRYGISEVQFNEATVNGVNISPGDLLADVYLN